MLMIRLDEDLEKRLAALAAKTGRTKTYYAREAIKAHLEEMEDYFIAEERLRDFRADDGISIDKLKADLGLDS